MMTDPGNVSSTMSRGSLSGTRPLSAPRSLTGELVARLADDITSGRIPPGSRLPTEQELIAATGVSRTVVREAVAALRADLDVMELRTGIEIEAAGLAAARAYTPQIRSIVRCLDAIDLAIKRGED